MLSFLSHERQGPQASWLSSYCELFQSLEVACICSPTGLYSLCFLICCLLIWSSILLCHSCFLFASVSVLSQVQLWSFHRCCHIAATKGVCVTFSAVILMWLLCLSCCSISVTNRVHATYDETHKEARNTFGRRHFMCIYVVYMPAYM